MNSKIYQRLSKALLLSGALVLGWAAHAQSTNTDNNPADSTNHKSMHRHDRGREFHRGGEGFQRGEGFGRGEGAWAFRGGRHGRDGGIHYTPEQRKQLMAINAEYRKKSDDLFKKDNSTLKEYKAGLVALQKEKKGKMEALLTQQQKDQLAARKKRAAENAQVMAAARMERLKIHLSLSDEQVARLKAGQENFQAQMKSIHENTDLLPQQKMEQLKDLAAKRKDSFKSVLTPEQLSKLQEMSHRQRPGGGPRHSLGEETK
ncbi:MAG TPA: hypothetical protein VL832_17080 [Puia sp.]|nr:hypothetical protein [Puia sp.]